MRTEQELVALTEKLIQFRSTEKRAQELNACADFIANYFADTSLTVSRVESRGKTNIVVTKDTKTPKVFLYGHYDVIEGEDEQFKPYLHEGKLYGRGAMDMKSGIAVAMHIMKELADTDHDVGAMFVCDEEIAGDDGVPAVLRAGFSSEVVVMPDGGNEIHNIITKEKGLLRYQLTAAGKSAHGSRPWLGKSATMLLHEAMTNVAALFPALEDHPGDHWVDTCNFGVIEAGKTWNQIPAHAKVDGDIRFVESTNPHELVARMTSVLPEGVTLSTQLLSPGFHTETDHPLMQAYLKAVVSIGRTPQCIPTHGRSDASVFSPQTIIIQGQPDGGNYHALDEWVAIAALSDYHTVVRTFLDATTRTYGTGESHSEQQAHAHTA